MLFVPDPAFEDPAVQAQFIPFASAPNAKRVRSKEVKPKKHTKMMQGMNEWDPVAALRDMPVIVEFRKFIGLCAICSGSPV